MSNNQQEKSSKALSEARAIVGDDLFASFEPDLAGGMANDHGLTEVAHDVRRLEAGHERTNGFAKIFAKALTANESGLLSDLQFVAKDMYALAGHENHFGSKLRLGPANRHAFVLEQLLGGGARLSGMAKMNEMALGPHGFNELDGHVLNPIAPDHMPGGSSSGTGALIADGAVDFGLGSDTAGSIRIPAHFCGVVGYKPSHGLVSRRGSMTLCPGLDVVGPLARNMEIMLRVAPYLLREDPRDHDQHALSYVDEPLKPMRPSRLGYFPELLADCPERTAKAMNDMLTMAGSHGVDLVAIDGHPFGHLSRAAIAFQSAEAYATHRDHLDGDLIHDVTVRQRMQHGAGYDLADHFLLSKARDLALVQWQKTYAHIDLLLMPCMTIEIPLRQSYEEADPDGRMAMVGSITSLSRPVNYLRLPSVVLPLPQLGSLPHGMQLLGGYREDLSLLQHAAWMEAELISA